MIPPCVLQSDFSSELIGSFIEIKNENDLNHGIVKTIETITRERLRTICKTTDKKYIHDQLASIEEISQEIEKDILAYFSKKIETHENAGFIRFGINGGKLIQSNIYKQLYILYTLRYGIDEASNMEEKMTDIANEGKAYIIVEYGRNQKNKELFIQRISLKETK